MKKFSLILLMGILLSLIAMPAHAWIMIGNSGMFFGDYESADGSVKYIKAEKKLILDNVNFDSSFSFLFASEGEIEHIEIIGENKIKTSANCAISFSGADVLMTGSGSLIIEPAEIPIIGTSFSGADSKLTIDGPITIRAESTTGAAIQAGSLELKNGAKIYAKGSGSMYSVWAGDGIFLSGGSEFYMDSPNHYVFEPIVGDLTMDSSSKIELITNTDFLSDYESYDASSLIVMVTTDRNRADYFSVKDFTPSTTDRISITQTIQDDGRYKAIIQGQKIIPETGDSANLALYTALLLLSTGMLVLMMKRKNAG